MVCGPLVVNLSSSFLNGPGGKPASMLPGSSDRPCSAKETMFLAFRGFWLVAEQRSRGAIRDHGLHFAARVG